MEADRLATLFDALRGGRWSLVAASAITIVVWLGRYAVPRMRRIPRSWFPIVSAALATLAAVGAALGDAQPRTAAEWLVVVENGVVQGAAASGLWSLVGRRLLPAPSKDGP